MSYEVMELFTTAKEGELEKLTALLGGTSDDTMINDSDSDGNTLLHIASQEGHLDLVKYLIDIGANLERRSKNGYTALHYASHNGHLNVVQYLIDKGADLNGEPIKCKEEPLSAQNAATELDLDDNVGHTPLYIASQEGHLDIAECLVGAGADVNRAIKNDETPLYVAADRGHLDIVKYLITTGAVNDRKDSRGCTPLRPAASSGHPDIVKYLISHGGDINVHDNEGFTPLHRASVKGHLDIVKYLISNGADMNMNNNNGFTPLQCALLFDHLHVVKYLISHGADINTHDNDGFTPLHWASEKGNLDIVEYLVDGGAEMNKASNLGATSLYVASHGHDGGHLDIVKYFICHGADINMHDHEGFTPLHRASQKGHLEIVECLLNVGAELDRTSRSGMTPLYVASHKGHLELVKYLITKGAQISGETSTGHTPLHAAAYSGHLDIVKYLISHGADINIPDNEGYTPLHCASGECHLDIVNCLVDAGAEVNKASKCGKTPLYVASLRGHLDIVKYLLTKGAEVDKDGPRGWTPLLEVAFRGHLDIVKYLISHGADINVHDNNGFTPLYCASLGDQLDIVECLVDAGAEMNKRKKIGATPLHIASLKGHTDIVKYLTTKGAEIDGIDSRRLTPLHAASFSGHLDIAKYLISRGADINIHDHVGHTPLHYASQEGHLDVVECLVNAGAEVQKASSFGETPLHVAENCGHVDIVKYLTTKGAEIFWVDYRGSTSLHAAAFFGHLDVVKYHISHGADLNIHDNNGFTPLHCASEEGYLDIVECLLNARAELNKTSKEGSTPLHFAADEGHLGVVKCLVNEGANVNARNRYSKTPLLAASLHGHLDVVEFLITEGANLDMGNGVGYTPIYFATEQGQFDVVDCLVNEGADLNKSGNDGDAPVHAAAREGQLHIMKYLIANGANIEVRNSNGWTVLHFASDNGNFGCLDYLLSNYTNRKLRDGSLEVGEQTSVGVTSLMLAARGGHVDCVRLLLDYNADVDAEDAEGWTAVHYAATSWNNTVIVDLLERKPLMIGKLSRGGHAPVHIAISSGNAEIAQFLLEKDSSSINAYDANGLSLIHLATVKGLSSAIEELLSRGADVNLQSHHGQTPLHLAIKLCRCKEREVEETSVLQKIQEESDDDISTEEALIQYLLNQGCKVDIEDSLGRKPIQCARDERIRQMVFRGCLNEDEVHTYRELEVAESREIHCNVGCEGGILYMDGCDVTMSIPPRKLQAGSRDSVSVHLATDPPPIVDMLEGEFFTGPGLDLVLPTQWPYSTDQPITLTVPHAASVSESTDLHADIIWKQTASTSVHREQYLPGSHTKCIIKEREVEITINAHSAIKDKVQLWIPMQLYRHADGKRMMCTPFLPTDMVPGEEITVRAYIHEDMPYILQNIQEEEGKRLYRQVHPSRCFPLEPGSKDLVLNCNGEEMIFSAREVLNQQKTLVSTQIGGEPNVRTQMISIYIKATSTDETQTSLAFMAIRSELSTEIRPKQDDMESEPRIFLRKEDAESETSITKEMTTNQYYHIGIALGLSYQTLDSIQFRSRALKESGRLEEGSRVSQTQKAAAAMITYWESLQHSVSQANYHLREIWKSVCDSADSDSEDSIQFRSRALKESGRLEEGSRVTQTQKAAAAMITWESLQHSVSRANYHLREIWKSVCDSADSDSEENESERNMQHVLDELPRDELWTAPTVQNLGYEVPGEARLWERRLHQNRSSTPSIRSDSLSSLSTTFDEEDRLSLHGEKQGRVTMSEYEERTFSATRTRVPSFREEKVSKDRRHKTRQPLQRPSDGRVAMGSFDMLGGKLSTKSHGFTLDIPPGALEGKASVEIKLEVLTELPPGFKLQHDECLVSHGFQCYPSGLHFKKPATLTIPHCAVLTDPSMIKTVLYSWDRETQGFPERILEPINKCLVRQHCLEISVIHFSGGIFAFIWDWIFPPSIRLSCMPFLPKAMPRTRRPMLEVRLVKKPHGQDNWREVHQFRESDHHQPAKDDDDVILFEGRIPSLTITCQVEGDLLAPETIKYGYISSRPKATKYFPLDLTDKNDESLVILNVTQTESQEIKFNTRFSGWKGPPDRRDPVSDEKLETLARYVPLEKYSVLSVWLGIQFSEAEKILARHGTDYTKATRQSFADWKNRTGGSLTDLKEILRRVGLGGLIEHIQ